jgi:hypothetical protein
MHNLRTILAALLLAAACLAIAAKDGRAGQEDDLHRIAIATEAIAKHLERCQK